MDNIIHGFSSNKHEFLSNFYACRMEFSNDIDPDGRYYPTLEHAYQAAKATNVDDMKFVYWADTPADAKRRGRIIPVRKDWEKIKDDVMLKLLRIKFENTEMRNRLIETAREGFEGFCEDNWWHDNYWGDCHCPACANIPGQNKLGKMLAQVRSEILAEEKQN